MVIARRSLVVLSIAVLLGSSSLVAQRGGRSNGGMTDAQRKAIQSILALADDAQAGKPTPNDLSVAWVHDDLLRVAQQGQAFVPFILTIDSSKAAPGPISVYWRVVNKGAPPPPPPDPKAKNPPPPTPFPYESLTPGMVTAGQPLRIARSFTAPAGEYDVYVVVKEGAPTGDDSKKDDKKNDKNVPAGKASVIKQTVTVPDLWNGELATSSIIVAEKVEQLTSALSAQDKVSRPYALGAIELVPYTRSKFSKTEQLLVFVLIYNAKMDTAGKPDVKVEFNFFAKQNGAEKPFNSTLPTNLNGQTLSAQDLASGQLQAGQGVPLTSFPEGDYRLEVKITDNVAKKEVKREVNFAVTGA